MLISDVEDILYLHKASHHDGSGLKQRTAKLNHVSKLPDTAGTNAFL